jgi:hypothetical protein
MREMSFRVFPESLLVLFSVDEILPVDRLICADIDRYPSRIPYVVD